jgi:hypothetical protein
MKRLIIALTISLIAVITNANNYGHGTSSLQINVSEYGHYAFEVNGYYYESFNNALQLNQLFPGAYRIRIFRNSPAPGRYRHHAPSVVYDNYIDVPGNAEVIASYNRFGLHVNRILRQPHIQKRAICAPPVHAKPACGMNGYDFDQLIRSIDNAAFDQTKLAIARSAIERNAVSTQQIAQIMTRFSFDSHRLELAKFAYGYCIDPQNYYQLTSQFDFESNARDLMAYIG